MTARKLTYFGLFVTLLWWAVAPLYATATNESITLPYSLNRWSDELFEQLIVEDRNNDLATWELYTTPEKETTVRYRYHTVNAADDYLYFPPMQLQGESCYRVHLYLHAGAMEYTEEFSAAIVYADERGVCAYELGHKMSVSDSASSEYQFSFYVPKDSLYRLAIHCTSAANRYMLYLDSLSIEAAGSAWVPDSVVNLQLEQGVGNRNKVIYSCITPRQYLNGEQLAEMEALHIYRNDSLIRTFDCPKPGTFLCDSDSVNVIGRYRYTAVAVGSNGRGIPATRSIIAGAYTIPFKHDFIDGTGLCSIVDNNHDNITWQYYTERFTGCMRYVSSATTDADDWIVTPPIYLSDSMRYEVHCSCCVGLSYYPETLRILLSRSPKPDSFSTVIDELEGFTFVNDTVVVSPFSVPLAGHYYIGFQAKSEADSYAILLRSIGVDIYDDAAVHAVRVKDRYIGSAKGCMTAQCLQLTDAAIYDLSGRLIATRQLPAGYSETPLPAGIYIVKAGREIEKIIVW